MAGRTEDCEVRIWRVFIDAFAVKTENVAKVGVRITLLPPIVGWFR